MGNMGERIKQLRESKGMTQEELGELLEVKKAAVSKYEKGEVKNMKRSTIKTLADLFGVSPTYLLGWDDKPAVFNVAEEVKALETLEKLHGKEVVKLIELFTTMNRDGQQKILEFSFDLSELPKYRKDDEQ